MDSDVVLVLNPELEASMSKLTLSLCIMSCLPLLAEDSTAKNGPLKARCLMGLEDIKRNSHGTLTIQNDELQFTSGATVAKVPVKSIEDIFSGEEMTQSGGTVGTLTKVALPYGGGRALSLILRSKIDILTLAYRDDNGGFHGVILTMPKGQGEQLRAQLVAGGAHVTPAKALETREDKKQ
jgi:hypothetical protein